MRQVLLNSEASHPMLGNLLEERYQIIQVLSTGTFGRKYLAEDTLLPGNPKCAIEHLKPISNDLNLWETVRRQFLSKTNNLKSLGEHDRIPQVLTSLSNDQGFYLIREFILGQPLNTLLPTSQRCGKLWQQDQIVQLLQEVLSILEFVHAQGFIHCNIKPNNIIKRAADGKFCLIGFGAIQPVQIPSVNSSQLNVIFDLLPAGYIPPEQLAYHPRLNSDIFALGAIAIQALSGLHPAQLQANPNAQKWYDQVRISDQLITILNQMVKYQYQDRYQSATEALQAIASLVAGSQESKVCSKQLQFTTNQLETEPQDTDSISKDVLLVSPTPTKDTPKELPTTTENSEVQANYVGIVDPTLSSEIKESKATTKNSEVQDNGLGLVDQNSSPEPSEIISDDLASISEEIPNNSLNSLPQDGEKIGDLIDNLPPQSSLDAIAFTTQESDLSGSSTSQIKQESSETSANYPKINPVSKSRKLPVILTVFGVGIAANALVMVAGLFYISQPDRSKFKQVEQFINQVQIEEGAKKVCQIPLICFWQKKQQPNVQGKIQTTAEVHQALQKAFQYAEKRDFTAALKQLEAISPQSPDYTKVKAKITEYRQKQRIKQQAEKSTKSKADNRRASR